MNNKSLIGIAKQNEAIVRRGFYLPSTASDRVKGEKIDIKTPAEASIERTAVYTPDELHQLLGKNDGGEILPRVEVVEGKTGEVARQVAEEEDVEPLVLNFASAKNPGGGYVRGTRAQEEDLCRCSTLYFNLVMCTDYYQANRKCGSVLYTDHMIYSRGVPFFRDEDYQLLDEVVKLSVITAPAPNAGEFLRKNPDADPSIIQNTMIRRIGMVLALAQRHEHRVLVLGAWGCGVFGNDPIKVADAFAMWLGSPRFAKAFDRVVFGIYTREDQRYILQAFKDEFDDDE